MKKFKVIDNGEVILELQEKNEDFALTKAIKDLPSILISLTENEIKEMFETGDLEIVENSKGENNE